MSIANDNDAGAAATAAHAVDDGAAQTLSAENDCRPQVALPPTGLPVWALLLLAVAIGAAVMLAINGRSSKVDDPAVLASYNAATVPPMPDGLQADFGPAVASVERFNDLPLRVLNEPAGQGAFARPVPAFGSSGPTGGAPAFGSAQGGFTSSEAAGQTGVFAPQPMPGAPGDSAGRALGAAGSSVVYDAGRGQSGGLSDDKDGEDAAARASIIRNRPALVAQGEIVSATLETPINSTRPGLIRAVVSRDVRSFDGSRVLIPRGSRLIGEFRVDQQAGSRRILATWGRLIRPDGVAIRLDSPAADAAGGIGMPGRVDTHFLARFANAALQTALQIGVNLASRSRNGTVIVGNTGQMPGIVGQSLIPNADAPPTVSVSAGSAITVFVARDLDFSGVPVIR